MVNREWSTVSEVKGKRLKGKGKRLKGKGRVLVFRLLLLLLLSATVTVNKARAQDQDLQQLILDIEKLTQFKTILSDMKTGYAVLTQGYGAVKDLTQGNFNLHSAFLSSLMQVSLVVRKYGRVADIVSAQASLVSEGKALVARCRSSGHFSAGELVYFNGVFSRLLSGSVDNLTTLTQVLTDGSLRMSDGERLSQIDQVWKDTENKLLFLRHFGVSVGVLEAQRVKELNDVNGLKRLY